MRTLVLIALVATALVAGKKSLPRMSQGSFNGRGLPFKNDTVHGYSLTQVSLPWSASWFYRSRFADLVAVTDSSADFAIVTTAIPPKVVCTGTMPTPTSGNNEGSLEVGPDFMYVGTSAGINAYDLTTCKQAWVNTAVPTNPACPTYHEATKNIYTANSGIVTAINAKTGVTVWSYSAGNGEYKHPAVCGSDTIVVKQSNGLSAFDVSNGRPTKTKWTLSTVDPVSRWAGFSNVYYDGISNDLFMADASGTVYKVNCDSGSVSWKASLTALTNVGTYVNDVMIASSSFSVWAYDGTDLVQLSRDDGSVQNKHKARGNAQSGILALPHRSAVFSVGGTDTIYAYNDLDATYQSNITIPHAGGQILMSYETPRKYHSLVFLTDDPSIVILQ